MIYWLRMKIEHCKFMRLWRAVVCQCVLTLLLCVAMTANAQSNFRTTAGVPGVPVLDIPPSPTSGGAMFVYSEDNQIYWYTGSRWMTVSCIAQMPGITGLGAVSFNPASALVPTNIAYTGILTVNYVGGGVGASYSAGVPIASTGVTGLTATLRAGTMSATGSFVFDVTGTPFSDGNANFAINCWGQNVTASLPINRLKGPDGTIVVDVISPSSGRTWMDRNLGTTQAATANITDPANFGSLYQWCRSADGHQFRNSGTQDNLINVNDKSNSNFVLSNQWNLGPVLTDGDLWFNGVMQGANNPCPVGYHVPDSGEWGAEYLSSSSILNLSLAGIRYSDGTISEAGIVAHYWTSTWTPYMEFENADYGAEEVSFTNWSYLISNFRTSVACQANGISIRCIKNE